MKNVELFNELFFNLGKNWNVLDGGTAEKKLRLFYINVCNDILPVDNARRCKSDSSACLIGRQLTRVV